jgi:hypothetical protein
VSADVPVGPVDGVSRAVCVQAVFHVAGDQQAQAVAAKMVDRAHEIANLPECECDVDVSVERVGADAVASSLDSRDAPDSARPAEL